MNFEAKTKEELIEYVTQLTSQVSKLNHQLSDATNHIVGLSNELEMLKVELKWYEEKLSLEKHNRFASKSEKIDLDEINLFNEVEKESDLSIEEPILVQTNNTEDNEKKKQSKPRKEKRSRDVLFEGLPVERIHHHNDGKTCVQCDGPLHVINQEITRYLKLIPAKVVLVEEVFDVCGCRKCQQSDITTPIIKAPAPNRVIPGSIASSSLISYVMEQKYVNSMPLYRQEQQFKRWGVTLSRQNLANWMIKGSEWLEHIYNSLHENLIKRSIIHADETTLQVLREPGKSAESKSYMWLYRTGSVGPAIVLYEYKPSRQGQHPENFLKGFSGYLQVDGYAGYENIQNATLVSCWAHARRKFYESIVVQPKGDKDKTKLTNAEQGFLFITRLYEVEKDIKDLSYEEKYQKRLERSRPILDAFSVWLNKKSLEVTPKSKTGQAITYCLNQWSKLVNYLLDGRLEIDNNRAERSIKPFVIGRKNFLFSNTPKGAKASAIIYSIVETAKENKLNPNDYLTYLFDKLPNIDINNKTQLEALLPWNVELPK